MCKIMKAVDNCGRSLPEIPTARGFRVITGPETCHFVLISRRIRRKDKLFMAMKICVAILLIWSQLSPNYQANTGKHSCGVDMSISQFTFVTY